MRRVIKRIGMALWGVLGLVGAVALALTVVAAMESRGLDESARNQQLMTIGEFQPLQIVGRVLVVDVRDDESFDRGRIPGAMHVPIRDVQERADEIREVAKGRQVVTYCSCPAEASSLLAVRLLARDGITAKALVGGFPRWVEFGGAVEKRNR